jgi:hypothetical protein
MLFQRLVGPSLAALDGTPARKFIHSLKVRIENLQREIENQQIAKINHRITDTSSHHLCSFGSSAGHSLSGSNVPNRLLAPLGCQGLAPSR